MNSTPDPSDQTTLGNAPIIFPWIRNVSRFSMALLAIAFLPALSLIVFGSNPDSIAPSGQRFFLITATGLVVLVLFVLESTRTHLVRLCWRLWLFNGSGLLALLVMEACLASLGNEKYRHTRDAGGQWEFEPNSHSLPGIAGIARYSTNSRGLRGSEMPAEPSTFRILCVGGGSTECLYVDDTETWPALLGQELQEQLRVPIWVGGAGISGYGTEQHHAFLASSPLVSDVNCAVLMVGSDDLLRILLGMSPHDDFSHGLIHATITCMIGDLWRRCSPLGFFVDRTGMELVRARVDLPFQERQIDWDAEFASYGRRIHGIIDTCARRNLRIVFVTSPTLWDDNHSTRADAALRYARQLPMPRQWKIMSPAECRRFMDRMNIALLEVCRERDVPCVDITELSGREALFSDDIHLSEKGCVEVARLIAPRLATLARPTANGAAPGYPEGATRDDSSRKVPPMANDALDKLPLLLVDHPLPEHLPDAVRQSLHELQANRGHSEANNLSVALRGINAVIQRQQGTENDFPDQRAALLRAGYFARAACLLRWARERNLAARQPPIADRFWSGTTIATDRHAAILAARNDLLAGLELSDSGPASIEARWLLNLADAMLDQFPESVPSRYRVVQVLPDADFHAFHEAATPAGLAGMSLPGPLSVDDFDGDQRLDILSTAQDGTSSLQLYSRKMSNQFSAVPDKLTSGTLGSTAVITADIDNDGALDVLILRGNRGPGGAEHGASLWRQDGSGQLVDVTQESGITHAGAATNGVFADFDGDGDLDLFLGISGVPSANPREGGGAHSSLLENDGTGIFQDITRWAGIPIFNDCRACVAADFDNDGDLDLFLLAATPGDSFPSARLFANRGNGAFDEVPFGLQFPSDVSSVLAFDYDNDGWIDLFVASRSADASRVLNTLCGKLSGGGGSRLYRNLGDRRFQDVTERAGLGDEWPVAQATVGDIDNDGFLDLFLMLDPRGLTMPLPSVLYRNVSGARFENWTHLAKVGFLHGRGQAIFADIDDDGNQDLFVQAGEGDPLAPGPRSLMLNRGNSGRFLHLRLVGINSDRFAVGARVRLTVTEEGKTRQICFSTSANADRHGPLSRLEIGLGMADRIDALEIAWPTGENVDVHTEVPLDSFITITEAEPVIHVREGRSALPFPGESAGRIPAQAAHLDRGTDGNRWDDGDNRWAVASDPPYHATLTLAEDDPSGIVVSFSDSTQGDPWSQRVASPPFPVETGRAYRVSFVAKADAARHIFVALGTVNDDGTAQNLGLRERPRLDTDWRTITFQSAPCRRTGLANLLFFVGGSNQSIHIKDCAIVPLDIGTD